MAIRAVRILRIQVVLWTGGLVRAHTMRHAVTGQAELAAFQIHNQIMADGR